MNPAFIVIFAALFNHVVFGGARMMAPIYAVRLDASPAVIGMMLSLFGLVGLFSSVYFGRMLDRLGARLPVLFASVLMAVGMALPAAWGALPALFFLCLCAGAAWNINYLANIQLMGQIGGTAQRLNNFAMHSTMLSVSSLVAPLIAGFMVDHTGFGWTMLLFALLPLVPIAGIVFDRLPYPPPAAAERALERAREPQQGGVPAPAAAGQKGSIFELVRIPALRNSYVVGMLIQGIWNIYFFLMPLHGTYIGLTPSRIGILLSVFAAASVFPRLTIGYLSRRLTPWQMVLLAMVLVALSMVIIAASVTFAGQMSTAVILGFALGTCSPVSLALMHEASPRDRVGEAAGLRVTLLAGIQTVAPLLAGFGGPAGGLAIAFWFLVVAASGGAFMAWRLSRA